MGYPKNPRCLLQPLCLPSWPSPAVPHPPQNSIGENRILRNGSCCSAPCFPHTQKIKRWEVKTRSNLALAASCPRGAQEGRALLEQRRGHPGSAPGGTGTRVPSPPRCLQDPGLALGPGLAWGPLLGLNHKPECGGGGETKIRIY